MQVNGAGASPASSMTLNPLSGPGFLAFKGSAFLSLFPRHNVREMMSFMISFVPPKMRETRTSAHARAIGYSVM